MAASHVPELRGVALLAERRPKEMRRARLAATASSPGARCPGGSPATCDRKLRLGVRRRSAICGYRIRRAAASQAAQRITTLEYGPSFSSTGC